VVAKLFQTTNPIGEQIRVRNVPLRVIGVLEAKGTNIVGDDQDDVILMPYSTVRKRLQGSSFKSVNAIMASGRSVNLMTEAEHEIRQLLYERHRISPGEQADFEIRNSTEIARMLRTITRSLTLMLASIAGLSLLVGGVGIMNIMLVSVTERTREIGIRMAVGARGRDILLQFLVEAALLASVGGVIGFCLGVSVSAGITVLINSLSEGSEWPMVVSIPAAITAVCFAAVVGLFFGYYPARRASRLDPIDALRYE
jgi:putative ABC transport system permease protein